MPAIPVALNDTFQVTTFIKCFNQILMNTWQYFVKVKPGSPTVDDVYNGLIVKFTDIAGVNDKLKAILPDNATIYRTMVQRIDSTLTPARVAAQNHIANWVGINGSTTTPNTDVVIERRGDAANRKDVGRVHILITPNDPNVNDGLIVQDLKDLCDALINSVKLDVVVAGLCTLRPCIWHRTAAPRYQSEITQWIIQDTARVMTRRTVGRGI